MRTASIIRSCTVLASILLPAWACGEDIRPLVELDHVYILVPDHHDAVRRLSGAGVRVDTDFISRQEGEGTASVSAIFENAYLEIKWVEPSVEIDDANLEHFEDIARARTWLDGGGSPFAVGLRRSDGTPESLPYNGTTRQRFAKPGTSFFFFERLRANEPSIFVVPSYMGLPVWIDEVRADNPAVLRHELGLLRLTGVIIEAAALPAAAAELSLRDLSFRKSNSPTMELIFDDGIQGATVDFRPGLPLVLKY